MTPTQCLTTCVYTHTNGSKKIQTVVFEMAESSCCCMTDLKQSGKEQTGFYHGMNVRKRNLKRGSRNAYKFFTGF